MHGMIATEWFLTEIDLPMTALPREESTVPPLPPPPPLLPVKTSSGVVHLRTNEIGCRTNAISRFEEIQFKRGRILDLINKRDNCRECCEGFEGNVVATSALSPFHTWSATAPIYKTGDMKAVSRAHAGSLSVSLELV